MAKTQSASSPAKGLKAKSRMPMRDIKGTKPQKEVFTIHQLKEETPTVEPLLENEYAGEGDVEIHHVEQDLDYEPTKPPKMNVTPVEEESDDDLQLPDIEDLVPKETIKVKFGKFVQLVANHDFAEVIDAHAEDEIIMSSNLLTDLAGANDKREERKIPLVFLVGIAIGVVLTYIFFLQ